MAQNTEQMGVLVNWRPTFDRIATVGLLVGFWATIAVESVGISVPILRAVLGVFLLMFVPGALIARLLGIGTDSFGVFTLFSVGFSFVALALINVAASVFLPAVGVAEPLSLLPLSVFLTAVLTVLLGLEYATEIDAARFRADFAGPTSVLLLLLALPTVSAVAAVLMSQFETNVGMFVFVAAVIGVVLLASTRFIPTDLYPAVTFFVSLSTLLHRNLVTDSVVGADIQIVYFIADLIHQTHYWSPELGGSTLALPIVTAVPATFAMIAGIELATTFKVVYVLLFSFVPVGVFYVAREVFDETVGLFAGLFMLFYHGSFYFTPGKQLVSELFVVLLVLLYFRHGIDGGRKKLAAGLVAVGLVAAHYGMTYVFGMSLLVATAGLLAVERTIGDVDADLSLVHPVAFLAGATAWYAYASSELIATLSSIPPSLVGQLLSLLSGVTEGAGASYVSEQSGVLRELNLYLYVLFTALIVLGLAWRVFTDLRAVRRGDDPEYVEYTAFAVPLFVFFGSSFFVIANLYADRVYQMVLPILAPFMAFGYQLVVGVVADALDRLSLPNAVALDGGTSSRWTVLAILLASFLALNSGMAFAVAGESGDFTFNSRAHDYAFSEAEREGGTWIKDNANVQLSVGRPDSDPGTETRVYTDRYSYQMFRSSMPSGYTTADIIRLKSEFQPRFYESTIGDGYVFIRQRGVVDPEPGERVPVGSLSRRNATEISETRNVVYTNDDAVVVESDNRTAG